MPEGVGYSDEELKAAETLLGASSAEELLQKASELGISLIGDGMMGGPPMEEPPMDGPPMEEEVEEVEESEEGPSDEGPPEGPAGLLIGLTTKRNNAAGKAMKKHGYK